MAVAASTASCRLSSPDPVGPVGPSGPGYGVAPRSTEREESSGSGVVVREPLVMGASVYPASTISTSTISAFSDFRRCWIRGRSSWISSSSNSPTISSDSDSVAVSSSGSSAKVASGSRGPATTLEIPSKTASHGLVETSRSTVVAGLSPARSRASRIAASFTGSETLGSVAIPNNSRAIFSAAFCNRTLAARTTCFAAPP